MPTVAWNVEKWDRSYDWTQVGDEWSAAWGGTGAEWRTCLLPRITRFPPTGSAVEIAPGFGRWTEYLIPYCDTYLGVDLADRCVAACRDRFGEQEGVRFAVNDGRSLPMVPDESVDLVFSFDSLVHIEYAVISAYLKEFRRVLSKDGVAFIHRSNVGIYRRMSALRDLLAFIGDARPVPKTILGRAGLANWHISRGRSMTAKRFAELSR
jgi:ubiquinone/menaquinone biosynthesis C-methylase UbiE